MCNLNWHFRVIFYCKMYSERQSYCGNVSESSVAKRLSLANIEKECILDLMLTENDYQKLDNRTKAIQSKLQLRQNLAPTKG